ncbi:Pyruvate dehydrogenase [Cryptosporidium ryanae]|uniref:Pyruvate dehydrogenase n=1 Tax=Cryptosporidium ryanae TaxID=515981 RepID=UPI00351A34F3|nr:Pyruvate dehydrogenase [Cryptosporidium ryanae]
MGGEKEIVDGCVAACHIAYACSEVAFTYPITPSSTISEVADSWMTKGKRNIFDQVVSVVEMQSEMGSAGALHGSLSVGCITTTFTASQGLLLMIPNMYKIAGELWPCVFHVTARALATSSLSIFGDHNDIMAARQTGWAFLGSMTVQEVMDMSLISYISTFESSVPFVNFFDGFRTSHELQKIEMISYDTIKKVFPYDKLREFRERALNPTHPIQRGTATCSDVNFQLAESRNKFYDSTPRIVQNAMDMLSKYTGRSYNLFDYYGHSEAEYLIVIMGSGGLTVEEMIDHLIETRNEKIGMIKVRLFRPWSASDFLKRIPKTVKRITVLDRCKESGALGEPLYMDVCASTINYNKRRKVEELGETRTKIVDGRVVEPFREECNMISEVESNKEIIILGGRYGLASKEFTPGMALSVWENMISDNPINNFSVGIEDDVTYKSLKIRYPKFDLLPKETKQCLFWGLGSDGTVSANKNAIKIIGDSTSLNVQGYFAYDAKKAGGATMSHLRFGPKTIKSSYLLQRCDYIAVHHPSYIYKFDVLETIKEDGCFVLNCPWKELGEFEKEIPDNVKYKIAKNNVKFYVINAQEIAQKSNLGRRINNILMVVFFSLTEIIPVKKAIELVKDAIQKTYGKKGESVVRSNWNAVDLTLESLIQVSYNREKWLSIGGDSGVSVSSGNKSNGVKKDTKLISKTDINFFVDNILKPVNSLKGDDLPVSIFDPTGAVPLGTTAYEKRGIAISIPIVDMNKCTQCNYCSIVCPHSAIRPFILDETEYENAPKTMDIPKAKGGSDYLSYYYRIQVSPLDCTGCELCVHACPDDALRMEPLQECEKKEGINWDYLIKLPNRGSLFDRYTVRGSQFQQPLLEFSAACEGCGETPYVKLLTQLFGERMVIANATGCSSIWGASYPSVPYTKNQKGFGPAWGNSLFEDNAEFGLGMVIGYRQRREKFRVLVESILTNNDEGEDKFLFKNKEELILSNGVYEYNELMTAYLKLEDYLRSWLKNNKDGELCQSIYEEVTRILENHKIDKNENKFSGILSAYQINGLKKLYENRDLIPKISHWIIGGDGWAYDIGYAGLDHVLAFGEDVNILILDTEVYSNTGGQASKSTPFGAIAKFAQGGNLRQKKDIGTIAMEYGSVYVASVALGANYSQTIKSLVEAERYNGTSLVVAYSTCIEHGYTKYNLQQESVKLAVETGYWPLYRYNPDKVETKKIENMTNIVSSGFTLDSKKIKVDIENFLKRENRFLQLIRNNPELATIANEKLKVYSDKRFQKLKNLSENVSVNELKDQIKKLKEQLMSLKNGDNVNNSEFELEREVNVLYGTETGNSEEVSQYIQSELHKRGYKSNTVNLNDLDLDELLDDSKYSSVVIVTSTSGQGEFPGTSKKLYDSLKSKLEKELGDNRGDNKAGVCSILGHMNYGIFGLGDSNYVYFNEAAKKWDELLTKCGATRIGRIGMGDDQSEEKFETDLMDWFPDYLRLINAPEVDQDDSEENLNTNRNHFPPETTYNVEITGEFRNDKIDSSTGLLCDVIHDDICGEGAENASSHSYSPIIPPNSFLVSMIMNERITSGEYDKDVRHIVLDLKDVNGRMSYNLGDSLALYGQNDYEESLKACKYFGYNPNSIVKISLNENNVGNKNFKVNHRYLSLFDKYITVIQLLVECLDLWGKPNRKFYQQVYKYCQDINDKKEAKKWSSQRYDRKLIDEFSAKTGTYMDYFYSFKSIKPTLSQLLDLVPFIKSRSYSIASSCKYLNGDKIELCVGIVDWRLENDQVRYGQCTGFINRLPRLSDNTCLIRLPCCIKASAFNLPTDNKTPIIMACMGTGLAPFRAFIQYKKYARDVLREEIGPVILYFGCRYYDMDYLYREELENYVSEGVITSLNIAFSRDNKGYKESNHSNIRYSQKMYVQHLMIENSEEIYTNLFERKGYFYLCGTKQVPIDIRKAIINIIIKQTEISEAEADNLLNQTQIQGRYNVEAWS